MLGRTAALLLVFAACSPATAAVVINEILYHAPDDRHDLQFIELHNTGDKPVALGGWKLTKPVKYEFNAKATIDANGYLVLCKSLKEFRRHYGFDAAAQYEGSLDDKGDILLVDAAGNTVERVKYGSRPPWPVAADGYGSSLERICPSDPTTAAKNWAPSPLFDGSPKARGTPGKQNVSFAPRPPPAISGVKVTPSHAAPDQEVRVEADVRSDIALRTVELRYRVAGPGYEKGELFVAMVKGAKGRYAASIPPQKAGQIIRFRIYAAGANGVRVFPDPNEVRPALSVYVHDKFERATVPYGFIINVGQAEFRAAQRYGPPAPEPSPRGKSAFVYVDQKTGVPKVFDFINVMPRTTGQRVRLHKDRTLAGMTTISLIYEPVDRYVLAEPLAYEVYRKAGNAAPRTDFVRTWIDGRPIGFQLLIEQPNKAFLRHNKLRGDGNMYKILWYGDDLVSQHEKKTNIHGGHADLSKLVAELGKTKGADQWAVIKKNFDVEQVINYFAVNMVLSHWDGYFNNYFTYHDVHGTGKWTMYPWDQDKTWGAHDGIRGYEVFFDMPLTLGMAGDLPPGWPKDRAPPAHFFAQNTIWWRPGGHFSKPLLANPQFRKLFLARAKELLEKVYTMEVFGPKIKELGERLEPEVTIRAELRRQDPKQAVAHLHRNLDSLRDHLTRRRQFLLAQEEVRNAGKFNRAELK